MSAAETPIPHPNLLAIAPLIEGVPDFDNYGTSQELVDHFQDLKERAPLGVTVDVQPIAKQQAVDGSTTELFRTSMYLGEGLTVYDKDGGHGNELAHLRRQRYLSQTACQNPRVLQELGIGRLEFLTTDRLTIDLNTWQFSQPSLRVPLPMYNYFLVRGEAASRPIGTIPASTKV